MKSHLLALSVLLLTSLAQAQTSANKSELRHDYEGLDEVHFQAQIESATSGDRAALAAKNIAIVITSCPTTHAAQALFAVGETLPVTSAVAQMLHAFVDGPILRNDGRLTASGTAYMLGGPLNALVETLSQFFKDPSSPSVDDGAKAEIAKAFKDGYFATRKAQNWNRVCYRAERRLQMLMGLETRIK